MKLTSLLLALLLVSIPVTSLTSNSRLTKTDELECLALNVYKEAANEPFRGKVAVAKVTLNRVKSYKFPDTLCKVVYQKGQFSWTTTRTHRVTNFQQYNESYKAALLAMEDPYILGENFDATHFHNTKVNPRWKLKKVAKIGSHIFYK